MPVTFIYGCSFWAPHDLNWAFLAVLIECPFSGFDRLIVPISAKDQIVGKLIYPSVLVGRPHAIFRDLNP